jgi:hypothetical protein
MFARQDKARGVSAFRIIAVASVAPIAGAQTDPGVRSGSAGAGDALPNLTLTRRLFFNQGKDTFQEVDYVTNPPPNGGEGLGPRFNMESCSGCHASPAVGGSSPATNPQVMLATKLGGSQQHGVSAREGPKPPAPCTQAVLKTELGISANSTTSPCSPDSCAFSTRQNVAQSTVR